MPTTTCKSYKSTSKDAYCWAKRPTIRLTSFNMWKFPFWASILGELKGRKMVSVLEGKIEKNDACWPAFYFCNEVHLLRIMRVSNWSSKERYKSEDLLKVATAPVGRNQCTGAKPGQKIAAQNHPPWASCHSTLQTYLPKCPTTYLPIPSCRHSIGNATV